MSNPIWIPDNKYGIEEGRYSNHGVVELLRLNCENSEAVYFIADMMEE